jgi:serine/threonine protein kinase
MFEILGKLGSGGFSIVDKVRLRNRLTLQEYAVSLRTMLLLDVPADTIQRKRIDRNGAFAKNRKALAFFENEVHNLKRLSHDHLVKFVGYISHDYVQSRC